MILNFEHFTLFFVIIHRTFIIQKLTYDRILFLKIFIFPQNLFFFCKRSAIKRFLNFFTTLPSILTPYFRVWIFRNIVFTWRLTLLMIIRKRFILLKFHKNLFHPWLKFLSAFFLIRFLWYLFIILIKNVVFLKIIKISDFWMFEIGMLHFLFRL